MSVSEVDLVLWEHQRRVYPVAVPAVTVSGLVFGAHCRLFGWDLVESTGSASAELDVWDSIDGTGFAFWPITFTPGQSVRDWFGPQGLDVYIGLWSQAVSGSVRGSLFVGPRTAYGR